MSYGHYIAQLLFLIIFLDVTFSKKRDVYRSTRKKPRNLDDGVCHLNIRCDEQDNQIDNYSVSLPIRGPKGPPGQKGSPGDRGEDGYPGLPGIPGEPAKATAKVAFFAGLSQNVGPVLEHTDVIFDRTITNIGGAYNSETGRFTASIKGVYQFNVVISAQGRQKAAVMIVKNGEMVATVWAESIPSWASSSNTVILELNKEDQVWLLLLNRASHLHGYMYSTFSGYLIFET